MSKKAIYAEDLLCSIRDDHSINGAHFARVKEHIEAAPPADAVEVVRCKDCEHRGEFRCPYTRFTLWSGLYDPTKDDDFCSYGERREGE